MSYTEKPEEIPQILINTCEAINANMKNEGIMAVPVQQMQHLSAVIEEQSGTMKRLNTVIEEQAKTLKHLAANYDAVCKVLDTATHVPESQQQMLSDMIVIPGVNGPRPEHAHLCMDTATDIMRAKNRDMHARKRKGRRG